MRSTAGRRATIAVIALAAAAAAMSGGIALHRPASSSAGTPWVHPDDEGPGIRRAPVGDFLRPAAIEGEPSDPAYLPPAPEQLRALPEARYDAVIPGLLDAPGHPASEPEAAYSLLTDAPLYGEDRSEPVARLGAVNFLGDPTVVVPIDVDGDWTLVLTPARQRLPSDAGGDAPAQTSAWIRSDALVHPVPRDSRIVVSVAAQSLEIITGGTTHRYDVGVGTPETPTPHDVTGYLQARYLDPAQGQDEYRVQLTSLHSSASDQPYGGADGGLIGLHYSPAAAGAVSHGCIRLSAEAIRTVDALPLGTPITVLE